MEKFNKKYFMISRKSQFPPLSIPSNLVEHPVGNCKCIYLFSETEVDLSAASTAIIIVSSVKSPEYVKVQLDLVQLRM